MKRARWVPQRSEQERQDFIAELRKWQCIGANTPGAVSEMRRIEHVLRLDWDEGWPEGESVPLSPQPLYDLP